MTDFFNRVGRAASDATKNVKTTFSETKNKIILKNQIASCKNEIGKLKISIGDTVYEAYLNKTSLGGSCDEMCARITELQSEIDKKNEAILALDGYRTCSNPDCRKKIDVNSSFCSFCGEKQTPIHDETYSEINTEIVDEDEN